jgi:hypothetical protein
MHVGTLIAAVFNNTIGGQFSANKRLFVFAERLVVLEIGMGIASSMEIIQGLPLVAVLASLVGMLSFCAVPLAMLLFNDYERSLHGWFSPRQFTLSEIGPAVHWRPRYLRYAHVAAGAVLLVNLHVMGARDSGLWPGLPVLDGVANVLTLETFVLLLALPMLASAARMPGTFGIHFGSGPSPRDVIDLMLRQLEAQASLQPSVRIHQFIHALRALQAFMARHADLDRGDSRLLP